MAGVPRLGRRASIVACLTLGAVASAGGPPAMAASGDPDRTFAGGVASHVVSTVRARQGHAVDVVRSGGARVLVANLYTCDRSGEEECHLPAYGVLTAFGPRGARQRGFGRDGVVRVPRRIGEVSSVATTPTGGIVLAGDGDYGGDARLAVYTSWGAPAPGFGARGEVGIPPEVERSNDVGGVAVDPRGRIAVISNWCDHTGPPGARTTSTSVVVFTSTGRRDPRFGSRGVARIEGDRACSQNRIAFQRDGRLLVAGTASGQDRVSVVRLNLDGTLDGTFATSGVADLGRGRVSSLAVGRDDSIVVSAGSGLLSGHLLTRLTREGRLDPGFGIGGVVRRTGTAFDDLAIDPRGRIVGRNSRGVQRVSSRGAADPGFDRRARGSLARLARARRFVSFAQHHGLLLGADGRLYLSGSVDRRAVPTRLAMAALRY